MKNLAIVIPDYKSKHLEKTIYSALTLGAGEIVVSNFKTPYTQILQEKLKDVDNIKFSNFIIGLKPIKEKKIKIFYFNNTRFIIDLISFSSLFMMLYFFYRKSKF